MDFKDTVDFCKSWFNDNNVKIPTSAVEWCRGRSGVHVPPRCTYQSLRRRGISVGSLLEELLDTYTNRVKYVLSEEDVCSPLGLKFLSRSGHEDITFECLSCEKPHTAKLGTLKRWLAKDSKYCSVCRGATGKVKEVSYYQKFFSSNFEVVAKIGTDIHIRHVVCGNMFTRNAGYITGNQRSSDLEVCCSTCHRGNYYVSSGGEYASLKEQEIVEHLHSIAPNIEVEREVLYKKFLVTSKMYRVDLWFPKYSVGIEITTIHNNLPDYYTNLDNKIQLAKSQDINIFIVTSKSELEDIVRTLLKDKEL